MVPPAPGGDSCHSFHSWFRTLRREGFRPGVGAGTVKRNGVGLGIGKKFRGMGEVSFSKNFPEPLRDIDPRSGIDPLRLRLRVSCLRCLS